ncbi:MAG: 23S rRNA (guanosine(2251)-2'-O)-methyltransferase RlmB [Gammaproteobacteria bacterium]
MHDKETIVYGLHAVKMLLRQHPNSIRQLLLQEHWQNPELQKLLKQVEALAITVQTLPKRRLDQLTQEAVHQGVVALCASVTDYKEMDLPELIASIKGPALLLILDGVQDPHNLGACLRSANAFGVHAVIAPKDRAVGITSVVRKVASGAVELTPLIPVTNLARTLRWLKEQGIWLYGADETATKRVSGVDFTGPAALVLGAEGKGLRRLTRELCDILVQIPTVGVVSSLNVAVATGIGLYEAVRQRLANE